jgi:hypothetical protein
MGDFQVARQDTVDGFMALDYKRPALVSEPIAVLSLIALAASTRTAI